MSCFDQAQPFARPRVPNYDTRIEATRYYGFEQFVIQQNGNGLRMRVAIGFFQIQTRTTLHSCELHIGE